MKFEKDTYTKEEVQKLFSDYESNYNTKILDFEARIKDADEKIQAGAKQAEQLKLLTKSNLENSIKVEMLKQGLDESMFDLVVDSPDIAAANKKIEKLVAINKKNTINEGYKPTEHNTTNNAYEEAKNKGDVGSMLKAKMSKLFQ